YDALDRRIEKSVNGVVTRYIYDNEDILLELDSNNQVIARYTHGFGVDESLIMLRGGQSFFYHTDGLGSIWDLTDNAGTPVLSYTYDSFGQLVAQTGTLSNPYTYSGREFDPETGLYYYRARHYMPSTARFIQTDLLFGLNRYSYVGNNPINFTDPTGLQRSPGFQPMDGGTDNTPGMPIFVLPPNASIGAFRDQIVKNFNWDVLNKFNADFNRERFFKELEIPFGEKRKAQVLCRIRRVPPNVIVEAIRILPEEDVILRTPIRGLEQIRSFFVVLEGLKIEVEPPRR
ncbi:MAG: RHS repeat domain-containing protein, partial [Nitrospiraceae bacterium]